MYVCIYTYIYVCMKYRIAMIMMISLFIKCFSFFYSGSDVVLSATYQASTEGFMKCLGITSSEANDLITKGVILAKQARSEAEEETG